MVPLTASRCISPFLLGLLLLLPTPPVVAYAYPAGQAEGDTADLKIAVLDGEDSVNIIKKKTAVQPVVEVKDKNNLPVSGAAVLFLLPESGPSGVFSNGTQSLTVVTDSAGRAAVTGLQPVGEGSFKISVSARAAGHSGSITISQTNILGAAAASTAASSAAAGAGTAAGSGQPASGAKSASRSKTAGQSAGIIGVASTLGTITLKGVPLSGTANLLEGSALSTTASIAELFLENGSNAGLGINSSVKVYGGKLVLNSGTVRVDNTSSTYSVDAMGYRIDGAPGSHEAIRYTSNPPRDTLQIASIIGPVSVYDSKGNLVKTVPSGGTATFERTRKGAGYIPTSGAAPASAVTDATALLIMGGLLAAGAGLGAYYGTQGASSSPL